MTGVEAGVVVIGGGPAGCAAALTLRRHLPELSVVIVDPGASAGQPTAGETLSPGVTPLLDYLGVGEDFANAGHLPAQGTASAWGSDQPTERTYLFGGAGTGWHIDRARFDAWMRSRAQALGAELRPGRAIARQAEQRDGIWTLPLDDGTNLGSRAVIDASGRSAQLARLQRNLPTRMDRLVADIRWYQDDTIRASSEGALNESVSDGWWYSASLPNGSAVAMLMTDADLHAERSWDLRLEEARVTDARLATWRPTGDVAKRAAHSQLTDSIAHDGWVAAGDAAATFDPISSLGIGFALRSGCEAARIAAATAYGETPDERGYEASTRAIFRQFRQRQKHIYQQELRWIESEFWRRRHRAVIHDRCETTKRRHFVNSRSPQ